ncbi:HNH endonuclease [Vibrio quintilis]|uniref:HNH endonuclease n=1 Tax=Vibrio quintilis TaxID=1117707 RepID=UPI00093703FE|nr:HNH endonuclease [Vibrio quintilis]
MGIVTYFLKDPASKSPPSGVTWHHHQDTGRMQLVDHKEHEAFVPHTCGMSIWGGGYKKKKKTK